jgi:fibronectin type 3 domain-containing protein
VSAVNEIGPSDYSDTIYVIAARAPETPTSFSVIKSTESSIEFMWEEPYDGGSPIIYYKVYESNQDQQYVLYAFTIGPENVFLVNNGLTAGELYSFKVISVNSVGESPLSDAFTYIAAAKPSTPGQPYWTSRSATTIDLEWPASEPYGSVIQFYNVYASVNSGQYQLFDTCLTNQYQAVGLSTGNNYKFQVMATNDAGQSNLSIESDFIIVADVPNQPTNVVRLHASSTYITIGWS